MARPVPPLFAPRPRFGEATPPAIFPPLLGALALGLAWRRAAEVFAVPGAVGDLWLGAMTLLFGFAALAYGLKAVRRPGTVAEDLRVLPGRAGLAALVLSVHVIAAALAPLAPGMALAVLVAGGALHAGLLALVLRALVAGPPEQRRVNPVWHLPFAGLIVAALPALALGLTGLAPALFVVSAGFAAAIWGASLVQFLRADVPAPLRPLLAIHLAPACLFGSVALALDRPGLAWGCLLLAALLAGVLLLRLPWLLRAGFSPLWGAFTFPLAALATLVLAMAAAQPVAALRFAGGLALVAATLAIPPILVAILRSWAGGGLGDKTNAARV